MTDLSVIAAENSRLPVDATGHLTSPRYLPPGSQALKAWSVWLKQHPRSEWPLWLIADIDLMKRSRKSGRPT